MIPADRVIVRDVGSDNKCRAGKSNQLNTTEEWSWVRSYHKHAANETSVVRDLQRLSTVWRVVVNEPDLSLSGKGLANVDATTELSCAKEPSAPRAASWTCPPISIDRQVSG